MFDLEEASQGRLEAGYEEPVQVEAERAEEVESIQSEEILQLVADRRRRQRMTVRGATVKTIWVKDELDPLGWELLLQVVQSDRRPVEVRRCIGVDRVVVHTRTTSFHLDPSDSLLGRWCGIGGEIGRNRVVQWRKNSSPRLD